MKIEKQSITEFLNNEYANKYVLYVLEDRSIPSLVDGMKPAYRKSLFSALSFMKKGISVSGLEIVGETYKKAHYHHGNSSIEKVIVNQGAEYSNNTSPFIINGSGGELRNPKSSAIRYLKFTLSEFQELYNVDLDILEHNYDGDTKIEPKFYLPLIPLILTSRTSGTGIGYAFSNNMSYSLPSVIDATITALENIKNKTFKPLNKLEPYVSGYDGEFVELDRFKWLTKAKYEIKGNNIHVTDLPISESYESFEDNLKKLIIKEKIIDFKNTSTIEDIKYVIKMDGAKLKALTKKNNDRLESMLKIATSTHANTYTFLNENKDIIDTLTTPNSVIEYFTEYRLSRYNDRKKLIIKSLNTKNKYLLDLSRFIKLIIDGELELRNTPIKTIKSFLTNEKITHDVLSVSITKQTKEEYLKILDEISLNEKEILKITNTPIIDMYEADLKELKNKFSKYKTKNKIIWQK